jgi:hypothetical protein
MKVCPKATAAKTREKKTGFIADTKKTRTSSGMVEREGKTLPSAAVYIHVCHRLRTASLANLGSPDRLANCHQQSVSFCSQQVSRVLPILQNILVACSVIFTWGRDRCYHLTGATQAYFYFGGAEQLSVLLAKWNYQRIMQPV